MRIISGKYKNKKLDFEENFKTRPLKDSVKENIFNILKHSNKINVPIKNSNILDLYAGTGSFGLECLSRDASHVFFAENDKDALKNLNKNIKNLSVENQTMISTLDISNGLGKLVFEEKFDLVFIDPPYIDKKYINIIKEIKRKNIMNNKHILILHREILLRVGLMVVQKFFLEDFFDVKIFFVSILTFSTAG